MKETIINCYDTKNMKKKIIQLENPCDQKWENMKPNANGRFCDLCSKNVIDLTELNQIEISKLMKGQKQSICARLTHEQLNTPLIPLEKKIEINFSKSKVAAGLLLASSLTLGQYSNANIHVTNNEYVQDYTPQSDLNKETPHSNQKEAGITNLVIFKGKIIASDSGKTVRNAKVTFVTSQKIIHTYTLNNGSFSMKIPENLIDNDNVIRVSYDEIIVDDLNENLSQYEEKDFILTKDELTNHYVITALPRRIYMGSIVFPTKSEKTMVLINGAEIKYNVLLKMITNNIDSFHRKDKDIYYFDPKFAIAIYGQKAKKGLYIFNDKQ